MRWRGKLRRLGHLGAEAIGFDLVFGAGLSRGRGTGARRVAACGLFAVALGTLALGCRGAKEEYILAENRGPTDAREAGDAGRTTPGCPPLSTSEHAKIAPFTVGEPVLDGHPRRRGGRSNGISPKVPPIVDPGAVLARFYDRVLSLARGTAKEHVRVAVYGDSNLTSDYLTGHLRRELQARFGDAGHGWVALARPWGWYRHENVRHYGTWPLFKQIAVTTDPVYGRRYGLAFIAAESRKPGAAAWVATAERGSPIGRAADRFEVHFLKQPRGGSFDILLDGRLVRTVSTASTDHEPGFELVETTDAAHELRCVIKGDGLVRWFGTTLERAPSSAVTPSIVVDSFGIGAMNFERFSMAEPTLRDAGLRHRSYDLVVVWLGTNAMWPPPNRAWAKDSIRAIHDALPDASVLIVSPPDSVKPGQRTTDPRIREIVQQLAEVSAESGAAFWDFREAMGGEASYLEFMKRGLASPDRAHLSKEGSSFMGQKLLAALFDGVAQRLEARPDAGCDDPRSP